MGVGVQAHGGGRMRGRRNRRRTERYRWGAEMCLGRLPGRGSGWRKESG